jgi:hypothetical protein
MTGGKTLRHQLEGLLSERAATASAKAVSELPIDQELHQIEQIDKLLHFTPRSNAKALYRAGLVGGICLIAACLLWTVRVPKAHVQLVATTESLAVTLSQPLNWSGSWEVGDGLLRLEEMSRIELPPELADENLLSGRAWVEIKNGDVALKHLEAKAKSQLSLARGELKTVTIGLRAGSVLGQLEVLGKPVVEAGSTPEQGTTIAETTFSIPGTVTFFHSATSGPATLRAAPKGTIEFSNLHVDEISFAKEVLGSDIPFESGVKSGTVTILSTGEKVSLEQGSRLRLVGADGALSRLSFSPDGAALTFEGEVRRAATGPPGFERELTPSLLEYLYHQQRLGFFWTVTSFLWGLLWSARTLLVK